MSASKKDKNPPKRNRGRPKLGAVAEIEQALLDVALEEFLQHGYGGASVSRIVRKAGISKTTVYSRFSSKEVLFQALMERQIDRLTPSELLISKTGTINLEQGLREYADHMLKLSMATEFIGVNRLMYSESHRFPELGIAAIKRSNQGVSRISQFISDCAEVDGIECNDPKSVAEVFILTIRGWYINAMLNNKKVTAKQRKLWIDNLLQVLLSSREDW